MSTVGYGVVTVEVTGLQPEGNGESHAESETPQNGLTGWIWRLPTVALAWRNLRRNRLRSGLAAVGIAIGIFTVVVLGVFGTVLQLSAADELGGIGNQVIISPADELEEESLATRDIQELERIASGRGDLVPLYSDNVVVDGSGESAAVQLYGTNTPGLLFDGADGELPVQHRDGAIVGPAVVSQLDLQLGSPLDVAGEQYRVVDIAAAGEDITPVQPDNAVILPEREFSGEFDQAIIVADSPADATAVAEETDATLNVRVERVDIFELSDILETIDEFFTLLNRFLLGLGSVSLVVAGVSIFNLMLMSTNERRGEIGVMRAVGIHKPDVLKLLLVEATLLGLLGGVIGAFLSGVAVMALWAVSPIGLDVIFVPRNGAFLLGGILFGMFVALASGLYPAWKAASERPVEALRG